MLQSYLGQEVEGVVAVEVVVETVVEKAAWGTGIRRRGVRRRRRP